MGTVLVLGLLALAAFGLWRWAVTTGSAGTLEWIDARFPRAQAIERAASGSYGNHPAQRAEIWRPAAQSAGPRPLVVFVHGGGWHSGAPDDYHFVARTFGELGYPTALIGYRLVPDGRFPAMLEDTAAGIAWAREEAQRNGIDSDRMLLVGHSAGAYNVLMMGLDPQWLAKAGVPGDSVRGIVSLAGPADFYPFTSDSSKNALGNAPDPRLTQPIAFARADAPPILLMHGTADTVVRPRNSRRLAQALRAARGAVEEREFEGMGHAGIIMGLSRPFAQGGAVRQPIADFLARVAAAPPSVPVQRGTR